MTDEHERVFVLRLGDPRHPDRSNRISLYDAASGDRRYFASLALLLDHLSYQLRRGPDGPGDPPLQS